MEGLLAEANSYGISHAYAIKMHEAENMYNVCVLGGKVRCGHCVSAAGSSSDGNKLGKSPSHSHNQSSNVPSSGSLADKIAASRAKVESILSTPAASHDINQTTGAVGLTFMSKNARKKLRRKQRKARASIDAEQESVSDVVDSNSIGASNEEVKALRKEVGDMKAEMAKMQKLIAELQTKMSSLAVGCAVANGPSKAAPKKEPEPAGDDDDEDFDMFGSDDDEDSEEKEKIKQQRLDAYAAKKAKSWLQ